MRGSLTMGSNREFSAALNYEAWIETLHSMCPWMVGDKIKFRERVLFEIFMPHDTEPQWKQLLLHRYSPFTECYDTEPQWNTEPRWKHLLLHPLLSASLFHVSLFHVIGHSRAGTGTTLASRKQWASTSCQGSVKIWTGFTPGWCKVCSLMLDCFMGIRD